MGSVGSQRSHTQHSTRNDKKRLALGKMKQMQVRLLSIQSCAKSGQVPIRKIDHFNDVGTKAVHQTRYYELLRLFRAWAKGKCP